MYEFELSTLVDQAMARYGNGREVIAAGEVVDLLLDVRLLVDKIAADAVARTEQSMEVV